jgi:hypothetical protein
MYLFAGAAAAMARAATGKPDLVAPDAVLLYTHADLKDTDFVEPLVCAAARARRSARIHSCSHRQRNFDVAKIASRFQAATAGKVRPHVQISPGSGRREGFSISLCLLDTLSGFNDLLSCWSGFHRAA